MGFTQGWGTVASQLEEFAAALAASDPDSRKLTITRHIAAPPQMIWDAWTDPKVLPRWFGPEGHTCETKEIDLRPGGVWRFDMIGPQGQVWANRHRYVEWDAPHRLAFDMDRRRHR